MVKTFKQFLKENHNKKSQLKESWYNPGWNFDDFGFNIKPQKNVLVMPGENGFGNLQIAADFNFSYWFGGYKGGELGDLIDDGFDDENGSNASEYKDNIKPFETETNKFAIEADALVKKFVSDMNKLAKKHNFDLDGYSINQ